MAEIKWSGLTEADAIANFNALFKDADPNAEIRQEGDYWVIEASAMKTAIPAVTVDNEDGSQTLLTPEEHTTWLQGAGALKIKG